MTNSTQDAHIRLGFMTSQSKKANIKVLRVGESVDVELIKSAMADILSADAYNSQMHGRLVTAHDAEYVHTTAILYDFSDLLDQEEEEDAE